MDKENETGTMTGTHMTVNVQLRNKQETIRTECCEIACVVELSNAEFCNFRRRPLSDRDFIKDHLQELKSDIINPIPCMLVLGEGIDDGILVDPEGYDYARYTAYIPMARKLFEIEQTENENDSIMNDDPDEEHIQGMTM